MELWQFEDPAHPWQAGVVFADGSKAAQKLPRNAIVNDQGDALGSQQWWPVIFVQDSCNPHRVVALCQAQALSRSRPWSTDITRIALCREATQQLLGATGQGYSVTVVPHDPVNVSTVVIEELSEDDAAATPDPVQHHDTEWTILGEELMEEF